MNTLEIFRIIGILIIFLCGYFLTYRLRIYNSRNKTCLFIGIILALVSTSVAIFFYVLFLCPNWDLFDLYIVCDFFHIPLRTDIITKIQESDYDQPICFASLVFLGWLGIFGLLLLVEKFTEKPVQKEKQLIITDSVNLRKILSSIPNLEKVVLSSELIERNVIKYPLKRYLHNRNPSFTGREDLLSMIKDQLVKNETVSIIALNGLGGIGKTQLANEYSHKYANNYNIIWWIRAEEITTLRLDYTALAIELRLVDEAIDSQSTVKLVRDWLENNSKWLLVFDNVQNTADIKDYIPKNGAGHIIITTRYSEWSSYISLMSVSVMKEDEAVEFLLKRTGQSDRAGAEKLALELGYLPLALEQASGYIASASISFQHYISLINETKAKVLSLGIPEDYPESVATTWQISFNSLVKDSELGVLIISISAFLKSENIPKWILVPKELQEKINDPIEINNAYVALGRYSLAELKENSISIHKLVQLIIRERLPYQLKRERAYLAINRISVLFPVQSDDPRTWLECSILLPHGIIASKYAIELDVGYADVAHFYNQAGVYLRGKADLATACDLHEKALSIQEKLYGVSHLKVVSSLNNLALVEQDRENLDRAYEYLTRASKIIDDNLGTGHIQKATNLLNIASVLIAQGKHNEADRALKEGYEITLKSSDPNDLIIANVLNNIGFLLLEKNRPEDALKQLLIAYDIFMKNNELEHPNITTILINIGEAYKNLKNYGKAKEYFEKARFIDSKHYKSDHPHIARDLAYIADIQIILGEYRNAVSNFWSSYNIFKNNYGEKHNFTSQIRKNLFTILGEIKEKYSDIYSDPGLKHIVEYYESFDP